MANEHRSRLIQEALDKALPEDMLQQLREQLDRDPQGSQEYNRLKQVDEMLRSAPMERAPARLALGIMAKLAQTLKPEQVSSVSSLALALALALVVLVALPVLAAAVSLFLAAAGSAAALNAIIQQIANLMALVVAMLDALVKGAQSVLTDYPQAPLLLVSVVPIIAYWLLRTMRETQDDADEKGT
jgi:hypothetical protein